MAFDTLAGLLYQVRMRKKFHKIVGMVCKPCRAAGVRADKAYTPRMTGAGRTFKEQQQEHVL